MLPPGPPRSATLAVVSLPAGPPPAGTTFRTVAPCRLADTRGAAGPALAANTRRDLVLTGACGIPSTAKALSTTVTAPTSAGILVAYPGDLATAPGVNTVAFGAGQTRANNAALLLAGDGSGKASFTAQMPTGSVHLVVDVNGWWE